MPQALRSVRRRASAPLRSAAGALALLLVGVPALLLVGACSSTPKVDEERQLEIHTEMARGFYDLGELERAKDQALKGLDIEPDNRELLLILGRSMLRTGARQEVGGAEQIFRKLLRGDPSDFRPHLGLGVALERKGLFFDEAAREIRSGERFTESTDPTARAAEHKENARAAWRESVTHYAQAVEMQSGDRDALNGLQRVHSLLDEPEEALRWSRVLVTTLSDQLTWYRLQLQRPEIRAGEEGYFRAKEKGVVALLVETHLFSYTLLVRLGREGEAIAELDRVVELDPAIPDAYSRRAQLLHALGENERAIHDLDTFLRLSKKEFEHPDIQQAYGLRTVCEAALARK